MSKRKGDPGYAPKWCIHYSAPPNNRQHICEAGINITDRFDGVMFRHRPCFLTDDGNPQEGSLPCEKQRCPTPEEIAAHKQWVAERMDKMRTVMVGIYPWRLANKAKSAREVVTCPACNGRLHLSIAAYNGHVHGKCETEGCVSWME